MTRIEYFNILETKLSLFYFNILENKLSLFYFNILENKLSLLARLEKLTSAVQKTGVSRHNRVPIEGPPQTP